MINIAVVDVVDVVVCVLDDVVGVVMNVVITIVTFVFVLAAVCTIVADTDDVCVFIDIDVCDSVVTSTVDVTYDVGVVVVVVGGGVCVIVYVV